MSTNKTYSEVIDEIRNRLDILDVVQSRVVLKKKGANDWYMSEDEALKNGIIDAVVTDLDEIF